MQPKRSLLMTLSLLAAATHACRDGTPRPHQEHRQTQSALIASEQVSALRIGATISQVLSAGVALRDTATRTPDGGDLERAITLAMGPDTVVAFVASGVTTIIEVRTGGLRTAEGIGVGTPVSKFLETAGPRAEVLDGSIWVELPHLCGVYFVVAGGGGETGEVLDPGQLRVLSDRLVERVVVSRCSMGSPR